MSKRSIFTTVTPLPPAVSREGVLAFLHDYEAIIDLNPLVVERHRIPAPANTDPDETPRVWYQLTDAIAMPWHKDRKKGTHVSYTCVFHPLPDGLQTHCRAPLGVDIRDRWSVGGTMPGEPRQPVELGLARLGAPASGLYLREDVDLRCNRFVAGFVRKTLQRSHTDLVARLASAASTTVPAASVPRTVSQNSNGSSNCSSNRSSRSINSTKTTTTNSTSCTPQVPLTLSPPPPPPLSSSPLPSNPYPTPYVLPCYQPQRSMLTRPEHHPHFPVQHRTASPDLSRSVTATPPQQPRQPRQPQQPQTHNQDKATSSGYQLQPLTYQSKTIKSTSTSNHKDTRPRPHLPHSQKQLEITPPPRHHQPALDSHDTAESPDSASTDGKNPYEYYHSPIYAELADGALPPVPVVLDTGARSRGRSHGRSCGRSRDAHKVAMK